MNFSDVSDYTASSWAAILETEEKKATQVPVECFDSNGEAMVVDLQAGRLVPAATLDGFKALTPVSRVVASAMAAPGWRLRVKDSDEPTGFWVRAIGAWAVCSDGSAVPLVDSLDGYLEAALLPDHVILAPG